MTQKNKILPEWCHQTNALSPDLFVRHRVTDGVLEFPMPVRLNGQTPGPGGRPIR